MPKENLIEEVFRRAGGRAVVQASLRLSKQSMSDMVRNGVVPIKHCPRVAALTGIELGRLNPAFKVVA